MLRQGKLPIIRTPLPWRLGAASSLIALAVLAAGLRGASAQVEDDAGPAEPRPIQPANPAGDDDPKPDVPNAAENGGGHPQPFNLDLVPEDAVAVLGVRPADVLNSPDFKPLLAVMKESGNVQTPFGVPIESIEQIVVSLRADPVPQGRPLGFGGRPGGMAEGMESRFGRNRRRAAQPQLVGATVRVRGKLDQKAVVEELGPEIGTAFYGGQLYLKQRSGGDTAFWFLDERSFALAQDEAGLRRMIDARNTPGQIGQGAPGWESARHGSLAVLLNVQRARAAFGEEAIRTGAVGINAMFAPLWNDTETIVGQLRLDEGLSLALTFAAESRNPDPNTKPVDRIKDTLNAMFTIGKNVVRQNRQMVEHLPEDERAAVRGLLVMAERVLEAVEVHHAPNATATVVVEAKLGEGAARDLVAMLMPAVVAARKAARQTEARNDLKQIGLAMHNYHDTHGHFPPPVVMGPDGKTPHSWRVELLPFLEQEDLFRRYRMDEPWDSEHNMKLLREMPAVFRHPLDDKDSPHTSYYALDGLNTLFDLERKDGVRMADITDGTSNTLMVVEAKKAVPWTKPEDIPYDPEEELPKLGGWFDDVFLAVLGDGSVHIISEDIDKLTLRHAIERNDGNPINLHHNLPQPTAAPARRAPAADIPDTGGFGRRGIDQVAPPTAPNPFEGSREGGTPVDEPFESGTAAPEAPQVPNAK